jgi:hypothetical protein
MKTVLPFPLRACCGLDDKRLLNSTTPCREPCGARAALEPATPPASSRHCPSCENHPGALRHPSSRQEGRTTPALCATPPRGRRGGPPRRFAPPLFFRGGKFCPAERARRSFAAGASTLSSRRAPPTLACAEAARARSRGRSRLAQVPARPRGCFSRSKHAWPAGKPSKVSMKRQAHVVQARAVRCSPQRAQLELGSSPSCLRGAEPMHGWPSALTRSIGLVAGKRAPERIRGNTRGDPGGKTRIEFGTSRERKSQRIFVIRNDACREQQDLGLCSQRARSGRRLARGARRSGSGSDTRAHLLYCNRFACPQRKSPNSWRGLARIARNGESLARAGQGELSRPTQYRKLILSNRICHASFAP